jgi:hemerythrin-like domain-containing protein
MVYSPISIKNKKSSGKDMRIAKSLKTDQETIKRFLDTLGGASIELGKSKLARPKFFILAHSFMHEYVEQGFFKKEEILLNVLEDAGFPSESGAIGSMRNDQKKVHEAAEVLINAAKQWQSGDEVGRSELGWSASEYTSTMRQHLERFKSLIFPLLEQTVSIDDEHKLSEEINQISLEGGLEKYIKLIEVLEEELGDWR